MRTQLIAQDSILTDIEDERIEPASFGAHLISAASSVLEKDTASVPIQQDQISAPILAEEVHRSGLFEPHHIGFGQRHPGIDTAQVTLISLAGILGDRLHHAIVHDPSPQRKRGPQRAPFVLSGFGFRDPGE